MYYTKPEDEGDPVYLHQLQGVTFDGQEEVAHGTKLMHKVFEY